MRSVVVSWPVAASLFFMSAAALSATGLAEAQKRYQQERAVCMSGKSNQDRATCLKEAGAALQEAKRDRLPAAAEKTQAANRVERCANLPASDKEECIARMREGTTSGSAQQGGVVREHRSTVPAR